MDKPTIHEPNKSLNWKQLIIWLGVALLIRWQIVEPRWIPSGSMLPTLQLQDRILVEKISPKINHASHKHFGRNSIIVFKAPAPLIKAGYDEKSALIKRVVGISGDEIEVNNGILYRNNVQVSENWLPNQMNYQMEKVTVPDNFLWVLGDNRNNSLDSHLWGPLPEANVIGTAIFRYWPIKSIGVIRFPTHHNIGDIDHAAIRSVSE